MPVRVRQILLPLGAIAVTSAIAMMWARHPRPAQYTEVAPPVIAAPTDVAAPPAAVEPPAISEPTPVAPAPHEAAPAKEIAHRPAVVAGAQPEAVVPLPLARAALDYVGADPDAEMVWAAAINDPALSGHARQDLIEDLNENGFADPHHPTAEELPLIVSRLALIEDMAPDAMDQTNADAFAEAYKDLANMYIRLAGPGG